MITGKLKSGIRGTSPRPPHQTPPRFLFSIKRTFSPLLALLLLAFSSAAFAGCIDTTPTGAVGTVAADGSVYAGLSTDGNVPMYTTRCDIGFTWNGSACTGTRSTIVWSNNDTIATGYTNADTGQANTAGLYPLSNADSPYSAAITCHSLNEDGHTDWYLPAENELNVMYTGEAAIGNFLTSNAYYWTSTDYNNFFASMLGNAFGYKNSAYYVRCVRKKSANEGDIIYNQAYCAPQYCDGTAWRPAAHPHVRSCDGTCGGALPAVGTVCTDGSVYAGLSTDGNVPMYTQRCDIGMTWSGSACTGTRVSNAWSAGMSVVTGITNPDTGNANTAALYPLSNADSPYSAAITCHSLNEDGHTNWYLPAKNELNVMYLAAAAIGNFNLSGGWYYASVEGDISHAWIQQFSTGSQTNLGTKITADLVRCVRR